MASLSYKSQVYAEDMEEEQVNRAITIAQEAFATNHQGIKTLPAVATKIRTTFDAEYGRCWNCVIGRSFGSFVTHRTKCYVYFSVVPSIYILLWKS